MKLEFTPTRFEGKGKIIYEHKSDEITFEINCNPFKFELKTTRVNLGQLYSFNTGRFEGETADGIKIHCDAIVLTTYDKYQLKFGLLSDLILGELSDEVKQCTAKLFGLTQDIPDFRFRGKSISFEKIENYNETVMLRINFGCEIETGSVTIRSVTDEPLDIEETVHLLETLCLLLSFVFGKNLTYNSYKFTNDRMDSLEYYRKKLISGGQGTRYVYDNQIHLHLPLMLELFIELNTDARKCYQTTILYLNSESKNYLEDSILTIAQIWEILSDTFLESEIKNTPSITELRSQLKIEIRSWHKSQEVKDYDLNFIMNRVLGSLDWQKAIKKMELLAEQEELNLDELQIDFKELVGIRNQIAHSGRFKELGREVEYLKLHNRAKLGIYVLLLNKIGYDGALTEFTGGLPVTRPLSTLTKK